MAEGEVGGIYKATEMQRKNFTDISRHGDRPLKKKVMKELEEIEMEFSKQYKPFCYTCAKMDFEKKLNDINDELEGTTNEDYIKKLLSSLNVDEFVKKSRKKYGDESFFELLKEKPFTQDIMWNGVKVPRHAGVQFDYKCVKRSHFRTMNIPHYAYKQLFPDDDKYTEGMELFPETRRVVKDGKKKDS